MSHQTGIRANETLKKFFGKCRNGKIRVFKVTIEKEELCLDSYKEAKGNWEEDYDRCVQPLAEPTQPTYILYRLDSRNETSGYDWLLVFWSPDDSTVRQKMLYASTKATLKQEFGSGQIKEELHATLPEEVTLAGLLRTRNAAKSPAPRTQREEELSELTSGVSSVSIDTKSPTLNSIAMPLVETASSALKAIGVSVNYVRLKIDIPAEKIVLDCSGNLEVTQLPQQVPEDAARYHLFKFNYFHEAKHQSALIFIYSMPGYNCPIKERMLYSSCKAPLLETIEDKYGLKIDKKLEVDSGKELTKENFYEELHPRTAAAKTKFDKPKGPPGRGAKRITKSHQNVGSEEVLQ